MSDFLARIGLVLEALVQNSTINQKDEALRLAFELQGAEDNFTQSVNERVSAALEKFEGRMSAVEANSEKVRTTLFSTETITALDAALEHRPEAREKLGKLFSDGPAPMPAPVEEPSDLIIEGDDTIEASAFNGAPEEAFDHDNTGSAGGSTAPDPSEELTALRKEYTEVTGKRFFAGWDAATLREKIAAAKEPVI